MHCIAHIDMDCFYAQVEAVRLGIDYRTVPFIVVQWQFVLSVSYPARRFGISRHTPLSEAIKKCPHVIISHAATCVAGDPQHRYYETPRRETHKISLEPYREASRKIFDVLGSFEGVCVERASIDEAYLDVTEAAKYKLEEMAAQRRGTRLCWEDVVEPTTIVIPDRQDEIDSWFEERGRALSEVFDVSLHPDATEEDKVLLCAASRVVQQIRQKLYDDLRYECSAGIAHNKLLAKNISSRYKPNRQTLLFSDRVASAMWDTKYQTIRGFGGRLGETVCDLCDGEELCRDAWLLSKQTLRASLPCAVDPNCVYLRLRCYDDDEFAVGTAHKSIMATKVFPSYAVFDGEIRKWVHALSEELCSRYVSLCAKYKVKGQKLNVKLDTKVRDHFEVVACRTLSLPEIVNPSTLTSIAMQPISATMLAKSGTRINAVAMTIGSFKSQPCSVNRQATLTELFAMKNACKRDRETDAIRVEDASPLPLKKKRQQFLKGNNGRKKEVINLEDEDKLEVIYID
ncbi:putative DNA polymerase eta [Trypanosoma vivax]|nr:putative DNA polymerase eta [Trypanosoma vivax]